MVIQDPLRPQIEKDAASSDEHRLAQPLDRLAAFVIDGLVVLTPLVVLSLSPLKRLMVESLLLHEDGAFSVLVFMMFLIGVVLVVAYQTAFVAWRGATFGKSLLGLRVVDVWTGQKPTKLASFIRAIGWLMDCSLLFVPHLEILTNRIRRPLHDRIAETIVVTERNSPASVPGVLESAFVRGVISAFVTFIFTAFVVQMFAILSEMQGEHAGIEEECQLSVEEGEHRLNVALRDFAAGLVDAKCLEYEANTEMQKRKPRMDMVYLAQSFAQSDDADVSNRYLEQVCETKAGGVACTMSKVIEAWSDENWRKVDQYLKFESLPNEPYLQVWALRHYIKQEKFSEALTLIERLKKVKTLSSFLIVQKVKSLWGLDKKDVARDLASMVVDTQETPIKYQVSQFICYEELSDSCGAKTSPSCKWMGDYFEDHDFDQEDSRDVIAFLKLNQCEDGVQSLAKWMPHLQNENVRSLVQAMVKLKEDSRNARKKLWQLASDGEVSDAVKREATHNWAQSAKKMEDLDLLAKEFVSSGKGLTWARNGRELFEAYFRLGSYQKAMDIGMKITGTRWASSAMLKKMMVASYQMGRRKDAYSLLKSIVHSTDRSPASEDEFSVIRRNLEKEFGRL